MGMLFLTYRGNSLFMFLHEKPRQERVCQFHFAGFTIKKEKEGDMMKGQFGGIMREKKAILTYSNLLKC